MDELDDLLERGSREGVLQLLDEEVRRVGLMGKAEEREREKDQRDEREEREVGDHRGEVGAAIGEELVDELTPTDPHGSEVCTLIPSERWTRQPLWPISSRSRRRSRRPQSSPRAASWPVRWVFTRRAPQASHARCGSSLTAPQRSAATRVASRSCTRSSRRVTSSRWRRRTRRSSPLLASG